MISRNSALYPDHVVTDFIKDLSKLVDSKDLKVTVKSSVGGGIITGTCATLGGLITGPIGLAIGSLIGGVASAIYYQGQFQPLSKLLLEMDVVKKKKLFEAVMNKLQNVGMEDIVILGKFLLQQGSVQNIVLMAVKEFIESQFQLSVI